MVWHANGGEIPILQYSISNNKIHILPYLLSRAFLLSFKESVNKDF
jgi:hypothetical protein